VVLTTVIEDASRRRYELETGLEMDVQDYVEKPVTPADLIKRVTTLLEQPYILVVDDDPDVVEGIVTVLKSQPYRLASASDGRKCMAMIERNIPDVLILDLLMPRMDGWAVIRKLRGSPRYLDLQIVVLTTVVEDASRRRYELETGMTMDVQAYLEKPVPPNELLRRMKKLLGEKAHEPGE
jgi:CheY-like chemotaxis protein